MPFLLGLTALVAAVTGQGDGKRYAEETTAPGTRSLPRPRCVRARLQVDEQTAAQWRRFQQFVGEAERVPHEPVVPRDPTRRGPGVPVCAGAATFGHCSPLFGASYDQHRTAVLHFANAARCGPACAEALLARALTTPNEYLRLRMVHGFAEAGMPKPWNSERVETLVLALDGRQPEPVREIALGMLGTCANDSHHPMVIAAFVDRVLARWPGDREVLVEPTSMPVCRMPGPGSLRPLADIRGLVRMAAATGDARVVRRLLRREKTHPSPAHVTFVLRCLQDAAPHVDEATARYLHHLFVLCPENLGPIGPRLTDRQRDVLTLIARLWPRLPDDLLPSMQPLLEQPVTRDHLRPSPPIPRR